MSRQRQAAYRANGTWQPRTSIYQFEKINISRLFMLSFVSIFQSPANVEYLSVKLRGRSLFGHVTVNPTNSPFRGIVVSRQRWELDIDSVWRPV